MSPARQLALSVSLTALGLAYGCTTSEPYVPMAPGGSTTGTGGAMTTGTGGATMGTGGAMDAGMEAAAPTLTFAKDIQPVLMANCTPCHSTGGGGMGDGGMSVVVMPTAANGILGNVSAANANCAKVDASKKRIVAGDPTKSFLYAKVSMTTAQLGMNCGVGMPRMKAQISMANQMLIHDWIMQGAN